MSKYKELAKGYWMEELQEKRGKGERISIDTPIPTSNENMIAGCLALYDKIKP